MVVHVRLSTYTSMKIQKDIKEIAGRVIWFEQINFPIGICEY